MEISRNALKRVAIFFTTAVTVSTAIAQMPTITSFSPASGPVGTPVTIHGTNFDATPANNVVYFGATQAAVLTATATELTVSVPAGATYQPMSVLAGGLTGYASAPFVITFSGGVIDENTFKINSNFPAGYSPNSLAIGDINKDGKPDLAFTEIQTGRVSVLENNSLANGYSFSLDFVSFPGAEDIAVGDLDGDGNPDLALANRANSSASLLRNQTVSGSVDFATAVDFAIDQTYGVVIGDIDSDGKPDLAVSTYDVLGGNPRIAVFKNTSSTGALTTASFAAAISFGTSAGDVAIVDVDADGKPDMIVTNYEGGAIDVFKNTATVGVIDASSFAPKISFAVGDAPHALSVGDLDGDGQPDLVVATENNISILRNTASAGVINSSSFAATVNIATGGNIQDLALSDLDGDGMVDIAALNDNVTSVSVFRNIAAVGSITTGSFAAKIDYETGNQAAAFAIGDLNGDGHPEIAVTNEQGGNSTISILGRGSANGPPAIATTTITTQIGGTATVDVSALLSDPDNNLDVSTLKITLQPISGAIATLDQNQVITIDYTGISFSGADRFRIEVCDNAGSCTEEELQVDVIGDVVVFNAISPNGDGLNDIFRIQFIEIIPETQRNEVSIYNRWGDSVFETRDYNNGDRVFTGLNKNGKELPSGVYFYKIQFTSGRKMKTGYLSLKR
jgi:gliding motility-associated-like protein